MCNNPNQRVWLMCPYCDQEQEIPMVAQLYNCNCCGAYLAPCSLCNLDTCDCASCEFAKQCDELNAEQAKIIDAVAFIAKEVNKDEVQYTYAQMTLRRIGLISANYALKTQIEDLLDDFSTDNDLDESWWIEKYDVEDIFYKVYDFINH